jgi:hypothetical protein
MGGDIGWGSGHLESIECPRRGSRRCSDGQAEMREDLGSHGGMFDGGEDRQGAAAVGTLFNIDSEHPFEQPGISLMRASAEGGGASPWSANLSLASGRIPRRGRCRVDRTMPKNRQ